jgi:phage terminase large subunit GpA-like protein
MGVAVANGVSVLVCVGVGDGVPGVLVTVGVLVGVRVADGDGVGVRVGLGGRVAAAVPGAGVSINSGGSSSTKSGGRVPSGVGVKRLRRGVSLFGVRVHALSNSVQRTATGTNQNTAMMRLPMKPLQLRDFDIYTTITYAPRAFNLRLVEPSRAW